MKNSSICNIACYVAPYPPWVPYCQLGRPPYYRLRRYVLKPLLRLYHTPLVHLHNHPREGIWIGRTINTGRSRCSWRSARRLGESFGGSSASSGRDSWLQHRGVGEFAAWPANSGWYNQPAGMTMVEAVEVSDMLFKLHIAFRLYIRPCTMQKKPFLLYSI